MGLISFANDDADRKTFDWFVFNDDDTFWLDIRTLRRMLSKYDITQPYFGSSSLPPSSFSLLPSPFFFLPSLPSLTRPNESEQWEPQQKRRTNSSRLAEWRSGAQECSSRRV